MAPPASHLDPGYRSALATAAVLNAVMFVGEGGVGLSIGSAALIADAVDFLEDAGMYTLAVIATRWSKKDRALAGLVMGLAMMAVGAVALGQVVGRLIYGGAPSSLPMAATAAVALAVNVYCAFRLAPWKRGDASMRSIWLSTRNDALLNALTIIAAGLVAVTLAAWPDLAAGALIAAINLWASAEILGRARKELAAAG